MNGRQELNLPMRWYNKTMNDKERQDFEDLIERVEQLTGEIETLNINQSNYTQKEVFNSRVVFRHPVYDKSGKKVIN